MPFYGGKIDGKAGRKTIAGIKAFQACFGFKDTGKILPGSAEIRKLRENSKSGVLKDIERATMGDETAGPASMARQKAIHAGAQASNDAKAKAPLPKAETEDLFSVEFGLSSYQLYGSVSDWRTLCAKGKAAK